jgi:nicotinamidase-related amidase
MFLRRAGKRRKMSSSSKPEMPHRSPELLARGDSALLVVDMQEKFLRVVADFQRVVWNVRRLIDAATILQVPCTATEQYPQKLGATLVELAQRLPAPALAKQTFSCCGCSEISADWVKKGVYKIVVAGIEAHVCVLQTVLDLLAAGFRVYVPVDAVGSRFRTDYETALRRMDSSGATLTTTEATMFEWCETSAAPEFKQISQLVKEQFVP